MANTILVTGCGGDIGQNIGRILVQSKIAKKVVGSDISQSHPGRFIFNQCDTIARADSPEYFENLRILIKSNNVDLIIPSSEPEIRVLHKSGYISQFEGVPVILANKKSLDIGLDKLATAQFLKMMNLPSPWTKLVKDGDPQSLPCIIKDVAGSGSKTVSIVDDPILIEYYRRTRPGAIWQELLEPANQEYTCGLYRTRLGEVRSIIVRRQLQGGLTGFGEIVENTEIEKLLTRLAEGLDLSGSINVQLRLTERGPIIFEINPRFSSTLMFRHILGFQDLLWSIQEQAGIKLTQKYVASSVGKHFYRGSSEYIW